MPPGFHNPFAERRRTTDQGAPDLFGEPDITIGMATEFLKACDNWQLPLFSLYIFYGLRASEPCWLFQESLEENWLKVACDPQLGYTTKGRRDKRLPLIPPVVQMLEIHRQQNHVGLLFQRRSVSTGVDHPTVADHFLDRLLTIIALEISEVITGVILDLGEHQEEIGMPACR
jgi:hypothetical protein